ncbi:hypothetical protein B296_00034029 [Ensete ventricosum]|uniref:Uncharacterized protein n=1 Tax=Ensete ventricosum TaxID=4639 RepID=A0A427A9I1_ENSVE|nr:hypothetical protein B296_00034029 [Ensete ventricosum]
MREGFERRKGGDGGGGKDEASRLRSQLELILHEALRNTLTATRSGGDPTQDELISCSPPLSPLATMKKKTKMMTRVRRGSNSPTWARTLSFTIAFGLTEQGPATYRVLPYRALLRVPSCPTPFSVMPSPSNECHSLIFLIVVLLLSAN